nr:19 kDa protein [Ranunculus white mottle virus]
MTNEIRMTGIKGFVLKEIVHLDQEIKERNERVLADFVEYKTSYNEENRFLYGSWLLTLEENEDPFCKKGIIIIKTHGKIVDCDIHKGIEITLANSFKEAWNSFYNRVYKSDLILLMKDRRIFIIMNEILPPKYCLKLTLEETKIKENRDKKHKEIKKKQIMN